jgi:predicted porin
MMKKSLIALAAVAATGAAMAQSSVTLSGKANIGFTKNEGQKAQMSGGSDGSDSRLIFRGTEDLGGGLKANFHFEHGFRPDTGTLDANGVTGISTANASFWQRQAWVGMSGGFGEVRLGRQYTLGFFGSIGNMPSTYVDPQLGVGLSFNGMGSRNSDQIQYWSPSMGGAQVRLSTQLAGDTAAGATEVALAYAAGPVSVHLTTADIKGAAKNPLGLNVAYNMGVATIAGGLVKTSTGVDGAFVRAVVPMGATSLFAGYARNSDTKTSAYDLGAFYSLSKRTRLYGVYGNGNKAVTSKLAVGVDHNF